MTIEALKLVKITNLNTQPLKQEMLNKYSMIFLNVYTYKNTTTFN
jgi:hypothetical protein